MDMNNKLLIVIVVLLVVVGMVAASVMIAGARGVVRGGTPAEGMNVGVKSTPWPGPQIPRIPPVSVGQQPVQPAQGFTPVGGNAGITPIASGQRPIQGVGTGISPLQTTQQGVAGIQPVQTGGMPVGGNVGGIQGGTQPSGLSIPYGGPERTYTPQKPDQNAAGGVPVSGAGITPSIPIPPPVTSTQQSVQPVGPAGQSQQPVQTYQGGQVQPLNNRINPAYQAQTGSAPTSGNQPIYKEDEPSLAAFWRTGQSQQPPQRLPGGIKIGSNNG